MRRSVLILATLAVLAAILATQCQCAETPKATAEATEETAATKKSDKTADAAKPGDGQDEKTEKTEKTEKKPKDSAAADEKTDAGEKKTDKADKTEKKPKDSTAADETAAGEKKGDTKSDKDTAKAPTDKAPKDKKESAADKEDEDEEGADKDDAETPKKPAKKSPAEAADPDETEESGGKKKRDPQVQKCREAAEKLVAEGDVLIDEVLPIEVTKAFELQDLTTSPVLKPILKKYGVSNVVSTDWRKDVEAVIRRRYTYDVSYMGFSVRVMDRNRLKPESAKGKCYSAVKTVTVRAADGSKLPVAGNIKVEISSMIYAAPAGSSNTRVVVAVQVLGLNDMEQSLYDTMGKAKAKEGVALLLKKLKEYAAKNAE